MTDLSYPKFKQVFDQLSQEYQFIIFQLLVQMEHNKDNASDKVDYTKGLKIAMAEQELTFTSLSSLLEEKTGEKELHSTLSTMIRRSSKSSQLFEDTLNILNINESFLIQNSEYLQSKTQSIQWLFESLPEQNKEAVYFLILQLTNLKRITEFINFMRNPQEINNLGLISDDN